jgi:hypothetical protein
MNDLPLALMQVAQFGFLAHLALTITLRLTVRAGTPPFEELFAYPLLGGFLGTPWFLRARFFWPWVESPHELSHYSTLVRLLFWAARLAGALFAAAIVGFLMSEVYIGVHAA